MATVKLCDRCEKPFPYKEDANNAVCLGSSDLEMVFSHYDKDVIDLCPECMVSFAKWLSRPEGASSPDV